MKEQRKVRFMLVVLMVLALVAGTKMTAEAEQYGKYEYCLMEDGTAYIFGYTGSAKSLKIPSTIKHKGKKIKVTGVDYFDDFSDCVKEIEVPDGVKFIGRYGGDGPSPYKDIEKITIPKSVKRIDEGAFNYYRKLSYIKYKGTKKQWKSIKMGKYNPMAIEIRCKDGILNKNKKNKNYRYVIQKDNTVIIKKYIGKDKDVKIPSKIEGKKVTIIDCGAFRGRDSIKSIVVPNGVKLIGFCAFHCKNLTKLTLPASVKKIVLYWYVFVDEYSNLTSIKYGGTRKQWKALKTGTDDLVSLEVRCKDKTINERKKTKDFEYIILKNNQIQISKYLGNAENAKIPSKIGGKTVTSIGKQAFNDCSKLKTITMPKSIYILERGAVYNCKKLSTVKYTGTRKQWESVYVKNCDYNFDEGMVDEWMIPVEIHCKDNSIMNDVERSKDFVYRDGKILKYISKSTKVKIPEEIVKKDGSSESIYEISSYAFKNCTNLKEVTIPTTITDLGFNVFQNCEKLSYIKYDGTKKQWKKEIGSNDENRDILCKDGKVIAGGIDYAILKSLKAGKKALTLSWYKTDNASGYQIQYSTDEYFKKNAKIITIKNSKATSTTIKKLKSGQKYYVRIRSYRKVPKTKKIVYPYNWSGYDNGTYETVVVK